MYAREESLGTRLVKQERGREGKLEVCTVVSGNVSHVLSLVVRETFQSNVAPGKWQLLVQ